MDMRVRHFPGMPGAGDGEDAGGAEAADASCDTVCRAVLQACLESHYHHLHRRLQRFLGCADAASDALHDTWLRLSDIALPVAVHSPQAYVYRMACNLATDRVRSLHLAQYAGDAEAQLSQLADPAPGPDAIAQARSDVAALARAMQRLPRRHQAVLLELRIDELTRLEVAARHGISLRRVDTVLRQALDYCAGTTDQLVAAGVRSPRRALSLPWPV